MLSLKNSEPLEMQMSQFLHVLRLFSPSLSLSLYLRQRNQGHENEIPKSGLAMPYVKTQEQKALLSLNIPVR